VPTGILLWPAPESVPTNSAVAQPASPPASDALVDRQPASVHDFAPHLEMPTTPRRKNRVPELRCLCAPRALRPVRWPKWLRCSAQNWLCFVARFQSISSI